MALNIFSLNCKGLRGCSKRSFLFNYFQMLKADIVFLQETHCDSIKTAKKWSQGWGGKCFWSFGTKRSSGVGILVNKDLVNHIKSFEFDLEGRVITLSMLSYDIEYQFVNVYLSNDNKERRNFLKNELEKYITKKNVILGGDFNFVENSLLDKQGGSESFGTVGKNELCNLKNIFNLVEPFRILYPNDKLFTWSGNGVSCRLDRFYVTKNLTDFVTSINHYSSLKSDHEIVSLSFDNLFNVPASGPGFWHCNVKVLDDPELKVEMGTLFE